MDNQPAVEPQIDNPGVGSPPPPATVLPTATGKIGEVPVGRLERAITAIVQGLTLLEGDGTLMTTRVRKSVKKIQERLTPAVYQSDKFFRFGFQMERLLGFMAESGDFRRSCLMAGVSEQEARRFLGSPKFLEFFEDRVQEAAVNRGWTADRFISELDKVWRGEKLVTREQMDAIKEIGARKAPKIERVQHSFEDAEIEFTTRDR